MIKSLLLAFGLVGSAFAQTAQPPAVITQFLGVNQNDPSVSIGNEAQDALNVESSLNGTALLKRSGYYRTASLTVSTSAPTGAFSFVDTNGDKVQIVCQDHNCAKSVNNAGFSVFLSTAGGSCMPTRWQFASIAGFVYAVNDCHDVPWRYDGTTRSPIPTAPLGSIIEATKDRLVISGMTADPSQVAYSQSGTPTNFTTGLNSADPYTDEISAQGDSVRGLKYALGRLFIFKTASIQSCILGDQYTSKCFPVSNSVGTSDPLSVVEVPGSMTPYGMTSGALMFRGSDGNYWQLDQNGLNIISKKLSGLVATQTGGTSQSNTQTSQADWQSGTQYGPGTWNTTAIAGSIANSTSQFVDNTTTTYANGSLVNLTTTSATQFSLSIATAIVDGGSFLSPTWYLNNVTSGRDGGLSAANNSTVTTGCGSGTKILCPSGSSYCSYVAFENKSPSCSGVVVVPILAIMDGATGNIIKSVTGTNPTGLTNPYANYLTAFFVPTSTSVVVCLSLQPSGLSISVNSNCTTASTGGGTQVPVIKESTTTPVGLWASVNTVAYNDSAAGGATLNNLVTFSSVTISSYTPTGSYTSGAFDTTFSTPTIGAVNLSVSSNSVGAITLQQENSSDGTTWSSPTTLTNGNSSISGKRYWRYLENFTTSNGTTTATSSGLSSLAAATTGQYVTQCIQTGSAITSWGQLSCAQTLAGNGSLVFYATSAVTCASLPTVPPLDATGATQKGWTVATNNATLPISVSSAVYIAFRSLLTAATDQAQVDACTLYWNNGTAAQPAWGTFDPVKNAVYWTASVNNSATSNRVLKYDMNLNEWYPFGLNATAIFRDANQNAIYFGDSTGGYWNKYGGVNSDNGAAINAYWISRDFGGATPFVDNNFNRISLVTKNQVTGSMTVSYSMSNGDSGSYSVSLSTTSSTVYVHSNASLTQNSPAQFMNINLGNNSTTPFEIDALSLDLSSWSWNEQNP